MFLFFSGSSNTNHGCLTESNEHVILTYFIPSMISRGNNVPKPTNVNLSKVVLGRWQSESLGLADALHQMFTARLRSTDETWWNLVW
jgi:hypothetical protein